MPKQNTSPMTSHYTVSSHSQTTLWIYGICDVSEPLINPYEVKEAELVR